VQEKNNLTISSKGEKTMLVLGRREGESIYVGENIILKVIKLDRSSVQIGIQAPPDVHILREELKPYDENKKLNRNK
jgi:carbon storage regulator